MSNEIGRRIKEVRETLGYDIVMFASKLTINPETISSIEEGTSHINDNLIRMICREFGIYEQWLRNGTGRKMISSQAQVENKFKQKMMTFYDECLIEVAGMVKNDKEYCQVSQRHEEISKEIEGLLPNNKWNVYDELRCLEVEINNIENELTFIKGLQYGIQFAKLFNIVENVSADENRITRLKQ